VPQVREFERLRKPGFTRIQTTTVCSRDIWLRPIGLCDRLVEGTKGAGMEGVRFLRWIQAGTDAGRLAFSTVDMEMGKYLE
jgi:hypothetical protein